MYIPRRCSFLADPVGRVTSVIIISTFLKKKCRRRENRDEGAEGVWCGKVSPRGEGDSLHPTTPHPLRRAMGTPPLGRRNFFCSSKSLVLLHSQCNFCKFIYDGWVALGRSFWLNFSGKQRTRKILTAVF